MRSLEAKALLLATLSCVAVCSGCGQQPERAKTDQHAQTPIQTTPDPKIAFPQLGTAKRLDEKIDFYEVTIQRNNQPMRVWVYVPEHAPNQKLPCVLIAPAGSPLIIGMALADGDRAEHLPHAMAGCVVVSYEIDGHIANRQKATEREIVNAATAFKDAKAGVVNARVALDFALEKVPNIDPERIYAAGHSSAATLALLVAREDTRIKACAAFAPVIDVEARLGERSVHQLSESIPGYAEFIKWSSPKTHPTALKCPVFLFHAKNDSTVPAATTARFAETLMQTNARVKLVEVPNGGHYNSMIREGVPQAIEWFRTFRG